jgi:hypothetical protein
VCGRSRSWRLAAPPVRLMGGCDGRRQGIHAGTTIAFGSEGRGAEEEGQRCPAPVNDQGRGADDHEGGDWISLAGLVVSVIGFSVAIRELIRIAKASEANRRAIEPAGSA